MKQAMNLFILTCIALSACGPNKSETEQVKEPKPNIDKALEYANKVIVQHQHKEIEDYIVKNNWHPQTTGTGLRYEIYKTNKTGKQATADDAVAIAYTLSLIDGTVCYTVKAAKPLLFKMGQAEQTKGLEEALCLMREGEKARLIVPDHLGYGLSGDSKEVPPKSTLVYDVELLNVK